MKRGGKEIYVGPLGHHSSQLISYFEVRQLEVNNSSMVLKLLAKSNIVTSLCQGIEGVSKIKDSYNPATWMLEVTTIAQEEILGVDFTDVYKNSELFQYVACIHFFYSN